MVTLEAIAHGVYFTASDSDVIKRGNTLADEYRQARRRTSRYGFTCIHLRQMKEWTIFRV